MSTRMHRRGLMGLFAGAGIAFAMPRGVADAQSSAIGGAKTGQLEAHECHRDNRGIITHCTATINGRDYLTFPGDYPADKTTPANTMYKIARTDDDTYMTFYAKPADAHATDPVERFVFEFALDGDIVLTEHEVVTEHIGNQAYWRVSPEHRGKSLLPDDDLLTHNVKWG